MNALNELLNDLKVFGSLAGMEHIELAPGKKPAFTFEKCRRYPNYVTPCRCEITRKESKRGAISYQFVLTWESIDGPRSMPQSAKFYTVSRLLYAIITAQDRNIFA